MPRTARILNEISRAQQVLLNAENRAAYDQNLAELAVKAKDTGTRAASTTASGSGEFSNLDSAASVAPAKARREPRKSGDQFRDAGQAERDSSRTIAGRRRGGPGPLVVGAIALIATAMRPRRPIRSQARGPRERRHDLAGASSQGSCCSDESGVVTKPAVEIVTPPAIDPKPPIDPKPALETTPPVEPKPVEVKPPVEPKPPQPVPVVKAGAAARSAGDAASRRVCDARAGEGLDSPGGRTRFLRRSDSPCPRCWTE